MKKYPWILPQALVLAALAINPVAADERRDEATNVVDISGAWTMQYITTTVSKLPVIGSFTMTTTVILAVDIAQDGRDLELTTQICAMDMENDLSIADTSIPDAFVNGMPQVVRSGEVVPDDDGHKFVVHRLWDSLGVDLDDPKTDELPDDESPPAVFDQDGDGEPGVSIAVDGIISGEIYLVRRGWDEWSGRIRDPNRIEGRVQWNTEQNVIGASRLLLRRQPEANPHRDGSLNTFRMMRNTGSPVC